jgi:hypothetical protein
MSLLLNGSKIPGYGLSITANLHIASEDLSGSGSSTATAEKGFKPKTFNVETYIRFSEGRTLYDLVRMVEGVGDGGSRTIYRVQNPLTAAMGVQQVRFSDNFAATPEDGKQCWKVSFSLSEYDSTAERTEARAQKTKVSQQKGTGNAVEPAQEEETKEAEVPLTGFEKLLKKADGLLA